LKKSELENPESSECKHDNMKQEGGFIVCRDCGLTMDENMAFEMGIGVGGLYTFSESQRDYERRIKALDIKAKQDPKIAHKYKKIRTLEKWYRDYRSSFNQQRKTIDLLKSYDVGLNIDQVRYKEIRNRYMKFNKKHRKTYQNMVIIFLAIVWLEIKDTTNTRIERFIKGCNELGHKINKKMLNNAMLKIKNTEHNWKKMKKTSDIEIEIKEKIKVLFQKDLNNIPYEDVKECFETQEDYDKLKIEMQLLAADFLNKISYKNLKNLNYKAFTAGLIYYIGQTLEKEKRKIFTQSVIEEATNFSSTTIRKKYSILKQTLGDPKATR